MLLIFPNIIREKISDLDKIKESEQGSPCTAGGLHMPNSKSMNSFAKRIRRMRHHSQCNPEIDKIQTSTGSSPNKGKQ